MSQQIQSVTQEANNLQDQVARPTISLQKGNKANLSANARPTISLKKGNKPNLSASAKPINFHFVRDQIVERLLDVRLISTKDQIGYHE